MKNPLLILALAALAPLQVLAAGTPQAAAPQAAQEPENALSYFEDAAEKIPDWDEFGQISDATARGVVEQSAAVFPLVSRGLELPLTFGPRDFDMGVKSPLEPIRRLGRLLALRSRVQLAQGDRPGALDSALQVVALGLKMQEGGPLLSPMGGYLSESLGLRAVEKVVPRLSSGELKAASRALAALESQRPSFEAALKGERDTNRRFTSALWGKYPRFEAMLAAQDEAAEADDAELSRPFLLTRGLDWDAGLAKPEPQPEPNAGANFDIVAYGLAQVRQQRPIKHHVLLKRTRRQAELALLEAELAVRAYWIEHKTPPATLQVLAPDYLPYVPDDPFDIGAALRMKRQGDAVRLYSVGPDGLDDDGLSIEDPAALNGKLFDSLGDLVRDVASPLPQALPAHG